MTLVTTSADRLRLPATPVAPGAFCHGRLNVNLPGDYAELGVYKGDGSQIIVAGNRNKKPLHMFDTYEPRLRAISARATTAGTPWGAAARFTGPNPAVSALTVTSGTLRLATASWPMPN
jgi:hypothetical protein